MKDTQYKTINVECKKLDKANTLSAVFSTSDMDRHGDIVLQNWELENYKANPVILNSHNQFDATEVVGKATSIEVKEGKLVGEIEFAVDANPKAKVIHDLYAGGFLKAFSVGFIPKEYADAGIISNSELLEISAVSVPANQMALAKAKGIDVDALETPEVEEEAADVEDAPEADAEVEAPEAVVAAEDEVIAEDEEVTEDAVEASEDGADAAEDDTEEVVEEVKEEVKEEVTEEEPVVEDDAAAESEKSLLNAVKELTDEYKGRRLEETRKKEAKMAINKAIRELLEAKKAL